MSPRLFIAECSSAQMRAETESLFAQMEAQMVRVPSVPAVWCWETQRFVPVR